MNNQKNLVEWNKKVVIGKWQEWLKKHAACRDSYAEAKQFTPDAWYQQTKRGEWIIWVLRKQPLEPKEFWVQIANWCAKKAKGYAPASDAAASASAAATFATFAAATFATFAADAAATFAAAYADAATFAAERVKFRAELADFIRSLKPTFEFKD